MKKKNKLHPDLRNDIKFHIHRSRGVENNEIRKQLDDEFKNKLSRSLVGREMIRAGDEFNKYDTHTAKARFLKIVDRLRGVNIDKDFREYQNKKNQLIGKRNAITPIPTDKKIRFR